MNRFVIITLFVTVPIHLLQWLRRAKFNVEMACDIYEGYLKMMHFFPWYRIDDSEIKRKMIVEFLATAGITLLKDRDKDGRKVILITQEKINYDRFSAHDIQLAVSSVFISAMYDEVVQVLGTIIVIDCWNASPKLVTVYNIDEVLFHSKYTIRGIPLKQIYVVNVPSYIMGFCEFAKTFMSEKLKSRLMFLKSHEDLKLHISPQCILPKEYGGTVPLADIAFEFTKHVEQQLPQWIEHQNRFKTSFNHFEEKFQVPGSFRKLQID